MKRIEVLLGKAQRRVLRVLLDGILDKAEMKNKTVWMFVKVKNGVPVNPATLVEK